MLTVTTSAVYDGTGQLTSATDGTGHTNSYGYDVEGNLTSETDPLTNATTYTYDAIGRRRTRTAPFECAWRCAPAAGFPSRRQQKTAIR